MINYFSLLFLSWYCPFSIIIKIVIFQCYKIRNQFKFEIQFSFKKNLFVSGGRRVKYINKLMVYNFNIE